MNLLDMVPALDRQIKVYRKADDTDSTLAAYLADSVEAMSNKWVRTYTITYIAPNSYSVSPDVQIKDKRPIILVASIIYKMGNTSLAGFRDGDFAYDPSRGSQNPIALDIAELNRIVPSVPKLAGAMTSPLRGYSNVFNPESYQFILAAIL